MSFLTIGHPWAFTDASTGKTLHFEYGSASSTIGPPQAFFIGCGLSKVRFAPDSANDFFKGLDGLVRAIRSGRLGEGSYFCGAVLDFDNVTTLDVDFGVTSGRLYFRLGGDEIEPRPDDLDRLNAACMEYHPLARSGRRRTGMGALLGKRERERLQRPEREPDLRDNYDRYVKKGEFGPTW
jgi:hypothetical protein